MSASERTIAFVLFFIEPAFHECDVRHQIVQRGIPSIVMPGEPSPLTSTIGLDRLTVLRYCVVAEQECRIGPKHVWTGVRIRSGNSEKQRRGWSVEMCASGKPTNNQIDGRILFDYFD